MTSLFETIFLPVWARGRQASLCLHLHLLSLKLRSEFCSHATATAKTFSFCLDKTHTRRSMTPNGFCCMHCNFNPDAKICSLRSDFCRVALFFCNPDFDLDWRQTAGCLLPEVKFLQCHTLSWPFPPSDRRQTSKSLPAATCCCSFLQFVGY